MDELNKPAYQTKSYSYSVIFWVFLIIMGGVLLLTTIGKKDLWQGFYYPNSGNLENYTKSPAYTSLDECRKWVNTQVSRYNPNGVGYDYECGKNCKSEEGLTSVVCEETLR